MPPREQPNRALTAPTRATYAPAPANSAQHSTAIPYVPTWHRPHPPHRVSRAGGPGPVGDDLAKLALYIGAARCWQASSRRTWSVGLAAKERRFAHGQLPGTGAEEPGVAAALRLQVARPVSAPARWAPSPGSGTGLEHGEVANRITVMLGLFLEHHLEAAAHDVLLVGIWVRRLATTYPIELGLGQSVDDTPHRGHASEPGREYLVERRGGFEGEPELRRCVGRHPAGRKAQPVIRRILLEHGITKPGIAGHQQVPLGLDERPLAVDPLVQLGLRQEPGAVERRLPLRLDGIPSGPVVDGGRGVTRQHPRGMLPVELGLDVGSHVDVVNNETLEGATEVDVAPIAVHDLQAADLAIANLRPARSPPVPPAPLRRARRARCRSG